MTLIHPDQSGVADCCLKEVIPEWLPGSIISSIRTIICTNLVCSIDAVHKVIIHINEFWDIKGFECLISELGFNPFISSIRSLTNSRNGRTSIDNCCHKQYDLSILPSKLKDLLIR